MNLGGGGCAPGTPDAGWVSAQLCAVAWFAVGHASGWVYNSALFAAVRRFGEADRAYVLGILVMFFGMGPTIWATVFYGCVGGVPRLDGDKYSCDGGFPNGDITNLFLLYAIVMPVLVVVFALPFGSPSGAPPTERSGRHFKLCLVLGLVVLAFVVLCNLSLHSLPLSLSLGASMGS